MRSRERRESKRNIGRLSVGEVRAELAFNRCSCTGPEARLLRVEEPGNAEIPWYPWDDAEDAAPQDAAPVVTPWELVEREQATARDSSVRGGTGRATTASSSGEDEPQRVNPVHSESALVHAPPTSTITVSAPITTVASTAMTTATMVTPSCGTRPTVGVTCALFVMQHMPSIVLSPEVREHLNGQEQCEYYSERYVRGVGDGRGGLDLPRQQPRVERTPVPQAPRRDARPRWYTAEKNYDAIRDARGTSDSECSEDGSEVDDEVAEELARQSRRWRADEQARASEGERRARELADEAAVRAEEKKAELARQKPVRKPTERVRVNRALRKDVRADHVQLPEEQA